MSEIESTTKGTGSSEKGFFSKLADGDFGLAKTYWLYGVLVGVIVNIVSKAISSVSVLLVFMLVYTAYEVPVIMGTWRASGKYKGPKVWAVLSKIAVILGIISLVIGLLAVLSLLGQS
jgi:hypothetical protein